MKSRSIVLACAVIFVVVALDQWLKFWIKTHFYIGEDLEILPWFHLRFVQNPGMAFGMQLGSKLFLTLFRILATAFGLWYIVRHCTRPGVPRGFLVCVALVVAGALGNIIDCVLYGEIFNDPMPPQVASLVPFGHGYGQLFYGQVVDMFYFPLFSFTWPDWLPWLGGRDFSFFDPVFNIADAAITVGILAIILFYPGLIFADGKKSSDTDEQ